MFNIFFKQDRNKSFEYLFFLFVHTPCYEKKMIVFKPLIYIVVVKKNSLTFISRCCSKWPILPGAEA